MSTVAVAPRWKERDEEDVHPPQNKCFCRRPKVAGDCPICFCSFTPSNGISLLDCGHEFCTECLSQYIQTKAKEGEVLETQMRCPWISHSSSSPSPSCGRPIAQSDVLACLPTSQDRERYLRLTVDRCVDAQDNMGCCPTPGCTFRYEWDKDNRKLECPLCQKTYCLVCQTGPWHAGLRCEDYQREKKVDLHDMAFQKFALSKQWKQCPKCKFWVERRSGCAAMHCRCNLVFCYQCGGCLKGTAAKYGSKVCQCSGNAEHLAVHERSARNYNLRHHNEENCTIS